MSRGRVQLKRIENKIYRHVTFSKRRSGLLKKAHEISVLCDVQVAVVVFSTNGKLYEYSTDPGIETILERYERHCYHKEDLAGENLQSEGNWSIERLKLKGKVELLHKCERNLMGEDLDSLTLRELHNLEQQLECGLKRIRTQKSNILLDSIADLQTKEKMLQKENHALEKKLKNETAALAGEAQENNHHKYKTVGTLSKKPLLNLDLGYSF